LLESREIKRLQPPFNSLEKQYRNYPFIKFVNDDGFPYPVIARFVDGLNGEFYGPFRSMHFTEEIMDIIDKQFKLRKCTADIRPDESRMPCLYHQIERCGSPCSLRNTTDEYEEELNKVRSFLSSFSNGIVSKLEAQMLEFADNLDFENAIKTKYRLNEVRRLFERQKNVPTSINQNNVIIIIPTSGREKTVEIFLIRYGRLVHQQEYGRKAPLDKLFELLEQTYYSSNEPEEPNTPQAVDELRIITAWQYRMQSNGTFAYVINKTLDELKKEVESGIRNAFSNNEEEIIENIDLQDYSSI
jgi:excinuclease UvrABC nuclease subunit